MGACMNDETVDFQRNEVIRKFQEYKKIEAKKIIKLMIRMRNFPVVLSSIKNIERSK